MPRFYASTSRGLSHVLAHELKNLDIKVIKEDRQGVEFEGPWTDCVRVNLRSRVATRVSLPVLDFPAYNEQELYDNIMKHDFTKYLKPNQKFMIKAKVKDSKITDQRLVAMKVKDGIADQFTSEFGSRPDVNKDNADVRVFIFGSKNQFRVSVDTTGYSLTQRGYRKDRNEAPLREHIAAGLITLTNWEKDIPLVDPMCGTGTLLIEAALMVKNVWPGTFHKKFSFQNFSHIEQGLFEEELEKCIGEEIEESPLHFYGFDKDGKSIEAAKEKCRESWCC